jgi:hypothetical protein
MKEIKFWRNNMRGYLKYLISLVSLTLIFNVLMSSISVATNSTVASITPIPATYYYGGNGPFENAREFDYYDVLEVVSGSVYVDCPKIQKKDIFYPASYTKKNLANKCGTDAISGDTEVVFPKGLSLNESREIPYLISPRSSLVLDPRPSITWNAIRESKKYTLFLKKGGVFLEKDSNAVKFEYTPNVQSVRSESITIEYPSVWPDLEPDSYYEVIVRPDNRKSSEGEAVKLSNYGMSRRGVSGLGFRLIDQSTKESILEPKTKLLNCNNLSNCAASKILYLSFVYNRLHLHSEAIQTLEDLIKKDPKSPIEAYRFLAEYYASSGLESLARNTFDSAKKNAEDTKDEEEQIYVDQAYKEFESEIAKQSKSLKNAK